MFSEDDIVGELPPKLRAEIVLQRFQSTVDRIPFFIGLSEDVVTSGPKLDALAVPKMDFRDYGIGAQILADLGIKKLRLLSRDRRKVVGLEGYGLEITDYVLLPKK